jgi:hypothetical protein
MDHDEAGAMVEEHVSPLENMLNTLSWDSEFLRNSLQIFEHLKKIFGTKFTSFMGHVVAQLP